MRQRAFLFAVLLLASCAHDLWISERLYFGRTIPGGGVVSDEEWNAFVAEVVTPKFPSGLTLISANGQWREETGVIAREPVMIIEILHPAGDVPDRAIEEIVRAYRQKFRQEAVLRVRGRMRVSFTE